MRVPSNTRRLRQANGRLNLNLNLEVKLPRLLLLLLLLLQRQKSVLIRSRGSHGEARQQAEAAVCPPVVVRVCMQEHLGGTTVVLGCEGVGDSSCRRRSAAAFLR